MFIKLSAVSDTVIYDLHNFVPHHHVSFKKCVDGVKFQTGEWRDKTL
jgi:hypothetical protein